MKLETGTIEQSIIINAEPREVYNAFMDPKKHFHSLEPGYLHPKSRGKITAWDGYIFGKNLKLVKGKLIQQEWQDKDWPKGYPPSNLKLTFTKKGNRTQLAMVHSKVPKKELADYAKGWKR